MIPGGHDVSVVESENDSGWAALGLGITLSRTMRLTHIKK